MYLLNRSRPTRLGDLTETPIKTKANSPFSLCLPQQNSAQRAAVEHFIEERFLRVHDAKISHFQPHILQVSEDSQIKAALGMNPGITEHMFLEQYLNSSVEQIIALYERQPVSRHHIVEIGNLAALSKPASLVLFFSLIGVLEQSGFRWMVFTATRAVERMLGALSYPTYFLADAHAEMIGRESKNWGRYYEQAPRVLVGRVHEGIAQLKQSPFLSSLFEQQAESIMACAQLLHHRLSKNTTRSLEARA